MPRSASRFYLSRRAIVGQRDLRNPQAVRNGTRRHTVDDDP